MGKVENPLFRIVGFNKSIYNHRSSTKAKKAPEDAIISINEANFCTVKSPFIMPDFPKNAIPDIFSLT